MAFRYAAPRDPRALPRTLSPDGIQAVATVPARELLPMAAQPAAKHRSGTDLVWATRAATCKDKPRQHDHAHTVVSKDRNIPIVLLTPMPRMDASMLLLLLLPSKAVPRHRPDAQATG